jgi:hypothetical protein
MKTIPPRALLAVAACLALLGLAACGTTKLEGPEVASQVKSQALEPIGLGDSTVKCPAETEAKVNAKIECDVTSGKDKGTVTATVIDEEGKLGKYKTETKEIQSALIEKNAAEEGSSDGVSGNVECPDTTEPKKGAIYFCTAKIRGSGTGIVIVNQESEAGDVSVRVQRRKLRTAQIEANITKEVKKQGIDASVQCPDKVTSQKGSTFECTVRNPANGKQISIVATQKDDEGNFSLKVK